MVFFWACEVSETKATAVEVPEGFVLNVCNATTGSFPADGAVSLGVETLQMDKAPWKGVVAHLGKPVGAWQAKLDLVFSHKVKFYLAKGAGTVHVSGYFQPGPPSDMFEDSVPLIVGEPVAAEDAGAKKGKKRAREQSRAAAAVSWDQTPSSDSETEEAAPKKQEKPAKPAASKEKPTKPAAPHKEKAAAPAAAKKEEKKHQQQPQATANGAANQSQPSKKKRNKKHKKANAGVSASQ